MRNVYIFTNTKDLEEGLGEMSSQIFSLIGIAVLVLSLPESYSMPVRNVGTSLLASLFSSPSSPSTPAPHNEAWTEWKKNNEEELRDVIDYSARALKEKYASIVAQVTFQTSSPWTHVLWIDKGSKTPDLPFPICLNAPVLKGSTLIGIVDFVGAHASRIRLISDPALHPAVRVVRGGYMPRQAVFMAQELELMLQKNPSMMPNELLAQKLTALLHILTETTQPEVELRLAKGELQGCEAPDAPHILRGIGFNCDFADDECPKRDLRTGQKDEKDPQIPLIKPGDILETSGLDGFFPKGLEVARVNKVAPLEEGAISYSILAESLASDFTALEYVTIIPQTASDPFSPLPPEEKILTLIESSSQEIKKE